MAVTGEIDRTPAQPARKPKPFEPPSSIAALAAIYRKRGKAKLEESRKAKTVAQQTLLAGQASDYLNRANEIELTSAATARTRRWRAVGLVALVGAGAAGYLQFAGRLWP